MTNQISNHHRTGCSFRTLKKATEMSLPTQTARSDFTNVRRGIGTTIRCWLHNTAVMLILQWGSKTRTPAFKHRLLNAIAIR